MANDNVSERVEKVIREHLSYDGPYAEDCSLIDDFGADSLDIVEIVMFLEEEFEVEISDDDYVNDPNLVVRDINRIMSAKMEARAETAQG